MMTLSPGDDLREGATALRDQMATRRENASNYMPSAGAAGGVAFALRGARFLAVALRAPFLAEAFFAPPRFLVAALRTPLRAVFFAAVLRVALRADFFAADFFVADFFDADLRAPFFAAAFLAGLRFVVAFAILSPLDPNCRNYGRPTIRANSVTRLTSRSSGAPR